MHEDTQRAEYQTKNINDEWICIRRVILSQVESLVRKKKSVGNIMKIRRLKNFEKAAMEVEIHKVDERQKHLHEILLLMKIHSNKNI